MANTTIYGGNFKDVLKSGRDSMKDKDNLKSIAVSTLGAGITSGLSKYIDGASGGIISKGTMQGASFKDQMYSALLENGLSNSVNVALESSINGDSFKESLKRQGLNMLSGTIETLGSKYIGNNYHNNEFSDNKVINKTTQLTLHAGLGAITSKISGGDYLNGAVSGVVGELTAELIGEKYYDGKDSLTDKQKENIINISGLIAGLSSIILSKSQGQDIEDITTNAYVGQRIGENAAKNNSFGTTTIPACSIGGPAGCAAGAVIDTGIIIGGALLAAYSGAKLEELVRNYSNNSNNKNSENNNSSSSSNVNNNVNNTSGASSSSASSGGMMPEDPKNDKDNGSDRDKKEKYDNSNNQNNKVNDDIEKNRNNLGQDKLEKIDKIIDKAKNNNYNSNVDKYGTDKPKQWFNKNGDLPKGDYYEFDLNPENSFPHRDSERIIIDKISGNSYYSPDHYKTFIRIK